MKPRFPLCMATVFLLFLFLTPVFGQDDVKSTVTSIEKSLWEAWKNNDAAAFREHLADNAVGVNPRGVTSGKDELVREITTEQCDVRDFSLSDWNVHQINDDTVFVTYKAKQDATCRGVQIPSEVVASSIYVRKDDRWLAYSFQATPLMDPATTRAED
jgi:ketosteroid isomerase-like protein